MTLVTPSISVNLPNALTSNFAGAIPFPASFEHHLTQGIAQIYMTAMRSADLFDLPSLVTRPAYLVSNLATSDYVSDEHGGWIDRPLADILAAASVAPLMIDGDILALTTSDLVALLREVEQYNFRAISIDSPASNTTELWLSVEDFSFASSLLLKTVRASTYVDTHDDCYVYIESTDSQMVAEAAALLLAHIVGAAVYPTAEASLAVGYPSGEVLRSLLEGPHFTVDQRRVEISNGLVQVPYARHTWKLGQDVSAPTEAIRYSLDTGIWTVGQS